MEVAQTKSSRWYSAFLIFILVVIWGASFTIYKNALLDHAPPILFTGIRTFIGGIIVLCIALAQKRKPRFRGNLSVYLLSSLLNVIFFFGLQAIGLNLLPAGLFSVLVYFEPVLVGVFSWIWLNETMSWRKVVGLVFGFLGVLAISVHSFDAHLSLLGIAIGIVTAICWAFGTVYSKPAQARVDTLWLLSFQFLFGGAVIGAAGSLFHESWRAIHWDTTFILANLFGGFLAIALAWMIYFQLVAEGEATRIAAYTFFVPLISVATSVVFLHEKLGIWLFVGLIFIVVGIYLTNRKPKVVRVEELPVANSAP